MGTDFPQDTKQQQTTLYKFTRPKPFIYSITMSETKPLKSNGETAAPQSSPDPQEPSYVKLTIIQLVVLAIGTGLAFASLAADSKKELYDSKIATIREMDFQWVYLALVVLGRTIGMLNFVPTGYKNGLKGNIRSNPFFYQTADDKKTMVLFQEDGPNGKYNRANRSVQHMIENSLAFMASIAPVGWLYPKQVSAIVCVFSVGRILHQKGYTSGYGGHAIGFLLATLSTAAMEGLAFIAFLKGEEIIKESANYGRTVKRRNIAVASSRSIVNK